MSDLLASIFNDFDRGRLSRRQLLQALGIAVAVRPAAALAQGSCGGARAGTPGCDPTPAKLPFERTGWNTVLLDHFSMQVADYQKEAAYYAALMNWKIRSDDGKQAVLDIGDWGGRASFVAAMSRRQLRRRQPRRHRRQRRQAMPAPQRRTRRWSWRRWWPRRAAARRVGLLLLGHRAVGREEGRSRAEEARPQSRRGQRSEAGFPELPRQGSGRIRSADQQRQPQEPPPEARRAARSRRRRRSRRRTGRRSGSITSRSKCTNYKETVAFYDALLGWKPGDRRRQPERGARSATSATRSSAAVAVAAGAAPTRSAGRAARGPRSHRLRHPAVGSGRGEGRARQARPHRPAPTRAATATFTRRRTRATTRRRRTDSTCKSASSPRRRAAANPRGSESAPGSSGLRPVRKPPSEGLD